MKCKFFLQGLAKIGVLEHKKKDYPVAFRTYFIENTYSASVVMVIEHACRGTNRNIIYLFIREAEEKYHFISIKGIIRALTELKVLHLASPLKSPLITASYEYLPSSTYESKIYINNKNEF